MRFAICLCFRPAETAPRIEDPRVTQSATRAEGRVFTPLSGKLRLVLGEHDVVLGAGEAAEFDTQNRHWFGSTGAGPVEVLSLFGKQGERLHLRARSTGAGHE